MPNWIESENATDYRIQSNAAGPQGKLPLTEEMLSHWPSGDLFGMSQNAGMGWSPDLTAGDPYLILSTQGGLRAEDGSPIALGYHTGHWEIGLMVKAAALRLRERGVLPFAGAVSDPCDGRTQGTAGMMDSHCGAKRTCNLGELDLPIWRAAPTASSICPEASLQRLTTCREASLRKLYSARVLPTHFF